MLMPQSGHAKFWEKVICSPSTISTMALPSVSSNTFSSESVSLFSMPGFTTRRSTTISILCFIFSPSGYPQRAHTCCHLQSHARIRSFGSLEQLLVLTLAASDHRCKKLDTGALRQCHNSIHHLIYSLLCNGTPALRTVWYSNSGIKQSEVIIYLCDRSDS